jgi:hypothetical protein
VTAGTGADGDACSTDADCANGLRCGIVGLGLACSTAGTADVGAGCGTSADCAAGLLCAPSAAPTDAGAGTCAPVSAATPVPFGIPVPPKLACDPVSPSGAVMAYFEVPGAQGSSSDADFFRLPFPNDVRVKNGKLDLNGFPTPGSSLLGFDPVRIYLDALTANESGWGTYPSVLFRFSGHVDFDTFRASAGKPSPVQFLDITDPANEGNAGASWFYNSAGGKYICHDWLSVRRPEGAPLDPGHTYAVFLSSDGRDAEGKPIERSPELDALLAPNPPSDPALADAYTAYAKFRTYLAAHGGPSTVLNATVFTTSDVRRPMATLAKAVAAAPVPTAKGWVKCGGGAVSPCPQADGNRACGTGTADYDEYQALISLPIFQKGTPPYLSDGGDIDPSKPVRTEDVCAALTVPKGKAPSGGYPVVVFAHGTGGSFRDHIRDEVAGALARATPPMAVLGYDQVEHGPRRGTSTASPNVLFFNFKNPAAARGNPMQGAADVISMGRFARTLAVPESASGGAALVFDASHVVFYGHSQGSMHGSLGLPYTNDYLAAVLSGNGASLMHALLTKTKPVNIAAAVPFALGGDYDGSKLFGGDAHPVLTIVQQWIDPADPLNFASSLAKAPLDGVKPKSAFQTFGIGDTYSPPITLKTYALAGGFTVAAHDPSADPVDPIGDGTEVSVPLEDNLDPPGTGTLAVREYGPPSGSDGHFVAFDVKDATDDVVRFLSGAASGQIPVVGQ